MCRFLNLLHKMNFTEDTNVAKIMNIYSSKNEQNFSYFVIILLLIILLYLGYIIYYKNKINNLLKSENNLLLSDNDLLSSKKYEDMLERYQKLKYDINTNNVNNNNKSGIYSIAYHAWLQDHKNMMEFVDNKIMMYNNIDINKISYDDFVKRCVVLHEIHYFWVKKHQDIYDNFLIKIEFNSNSSTMNNFPNNEIDKFKKLLSKEKECYNVFINSIPSLLKYEKKINIDELRRRYLNFILS